jgi:integrase
MPEFYPTLARTGLRIGEALALKREDLDFHLTSVEKVGGNPNKARRLLGR